MNAHSHTFTKRTLVTAVNSVVNESNFVQSVNVEDTEFYTSMANMVWDEFQIILDWIQGAEPTARNKWAFEHDLNADQMKYLEKYGSQMSLGKAKAFLGQKYKTNNVDRMIYNTIRDRRMNSIKDYEHLAEFLFINSLPQL